MIGRGEFAFAGAPAAARFAPPESDLPFWVAAFAVAIFLHAAAVVALLDHRAPPPAQQEAMVVELAPLVHTIEQPAAVLPPPEPVPEPEIKAAPPPPPVVQPEPAPEPPPVIESETESVAAPPVPKPRPKPPEPAQPQATARPEPVREPDFSAWSALDQQPPQPPQSAVQRRVDQAPNEYLMRIHAQMERYKIYPRAARAHGVEGLVQLTFVIDRGGRVVSHRIVRGSGYLVLDSAVDDMIKRATPFPPFPAGMQGEELEITMAVTFYMR
jgi:protein TonB